MTGRGGKEERQRRQGEFQETVSSLATHPCPFEYDVIKSNTPKRCFASFLPVATTTTTPMPTTKRETHQSSPHELWFPAATQWQNSGKPLGRLSIATALGTRLLSSRSTYSTGRWHSKTRGTFKVATPSRCDGPFFLRRFGVVEQPRRRTSSHGTIFAHHHHHRGRRRSPNK